MPFSRAKPFREAGPIGKPFVLHLLAATLAPKGLAGGA